jgi:hypothetical protein
MSKLRPEEIALSMQAFLTSLFLELEWVIREAGVDISSGLAPWLRRSMTDKQSFFSQNKWRREFYEKVVRGANVSALLFYLPNSLLMVNQMLEKNVRFDPSANNSLSKSPPHAQFSTKDGWFN